MIQLVVSRPKLTGRLDKRRPSIPCRAQSVPRKHGRPTAALLPNEQWLDRGDESASAAVDRRRQQHFFANSRVETIAPFAAELLKMCM